MKIPSLLAITATLLLPALASAQATRTWVSGVGDDANPGSRTAPCKTFAGAISKTAAGGVIDVLDPGGFGAVTITKSITIEGVSAEGGILVAGTHGVIINAGTNDVVTLRNLTFEGVGTGLSGVQILSVGAVHIENCRFNGFIANGINLATSAADAQLFVKDTTIHKCSPAGIHLAPNAPATALIENVNITGCVDGVNAETNVTAVAVNTTASGNAGVGFLVGSNSNLTITRCTSVDNQIGVQSLGTAILSETTVANNAADGLLVTKPAKIISCHNNRIFGNTPNGKANGAIGSK